MIENKDLREWKSNSFSLLLKQNKYALEIYNYLNGSNYEDPDLVQIEEIEGVIYLSVRNDAIFILDGYINLYEHQSTVCPNMPLRQLLYIAAFYKQYVRGLDLYGTVLIQIPVPRMAVFYNGKAAQPETMVMKLSDAYQRHDPDPMLELRCNFYNINSGYNADLKAKCSSIDGYSKYVDKTREYLKTNDIRSSLNAAIDDCIREGILSDFFKEYKSMIIEADALDYSHEARERMARESALKEGFDLGMEQGIEQGIVRGTKELLKSMVKKKLAKGCTAAQIADMLEEDISAINSIIATLNG